MYIFVYTYTSMYFLMEMLTKFKIVTNKSKLYKCLAKPLKTMF